MGKKSIFILFKEVKMVEGSKLSKLLIVRYTITIVINVLFLLSIHRYRSINIGCIVTALLFLCRFC